MYNFIIYIIAMISVGHQKLSVAISCDYLIVLLRNN